MNQTFQIIKFKVEDIEMDVNFSSEDKTVWLSAKDLCILYGKNKSTIWRYIKKINEEIENRAVSQNATTDVKNATASVKNETTGPDGKRYIVNYYSLDVALEIGRRIGSDRGLLLKKSLDDYLSQETIENNQDIITYNNGNIKLDVKISPEEDTVWLNQAQIAELFETARQNITMHINNIYETGELEVGATCKDFLLVQLEGGRKVTRNIAYYNLDMIISLGYRVNTSRGIEFRRWATNVLKRYLLKGYAIDKARVMVTTENFVQLENDISLLKTRMDKVEKQVYEEPPREKIFFNGEYYSAYEFLSSIIRNAKESIIIIDPYCDNKILTFLKNKNANVNVTVYGSSKSKLTEGEINIFVNQFGGLFIYKSTDLFHDRFLIIDSKICYSLGTSLNYMGNKVFSIHKFEDNDLIEVLINKIIHK